MSRRLLAIIFLLAALHLTGQVSAASNWRPFTQQDLKLSAVSLGDPEADAAILFREGELNDNTPEGTNLKVYIRIKIFNDRGRRYADVQLPYRVEMGKITDVRARTIRPDGTTVDVESRDIFDKVVLKTSHGVWRAKTFSMPAVEAGAIIEYRYRQAYPQGFRYFALDLQSELFTRELRYSIQPQAASKLDVRWVSFNAQDARRFAPVWDGTFNITAENIPPFRREPMMPPELSVKTWGWLYYSSEIETKPDKYWRDYAERMYDRTSYETKPDRAIKRVVEAITLSTDGPREKAARIYSYVQNEIKNLGFKEEGGEEAESEAALKRNAPVDEVLRQRFGTPRDINRLFISMLQAAGLDARVAELTTRDENYFHRTFPDSFQFNSEVTAVVARDGSVEFYDPGTPYCPVAMLPWEKEAVTALVYGKRDWRFIETPLTEAARSGEDRQVSLAVSGSGQVDARVEFKATGQRALELRNDLVDLMPDEQPRRIAKAVRDLLPAATVNESTVAISNLTQAAAPLGATYSFSVPQFATRTERRLLVRPALLSHPDESLTAAPRRSNSIYFHYPWSETERVVIEPPAGYTVEQLPDPVEIDIGAARYRAAFRRDGGRVVYERRLVVSGIIFSVDQYPTVKAFFDRVHQSDRTTISFKQ
jgi:transglutaminase-like putative cysteine protease